MSQRRVKQLRRIVRRERAGIAWDSYEQTLALPFAERWEIALSILTRRRPWIVTAAVVGAFLIGLGGVVIWIT